MKRAVIHIGVNTCKLAVVTESMWRQLIRKLKHVFPEAAVLVSSIVPPMGRLRKTEQVSNAALLAVCNREKVSVVNHTDAFTAWSGVPLKHLYRDQLHPSDCGTSRMVFNLQLATGALRRQAHHHPAKLSPSTKTRPGTAPAATGRNQTTPCSQTFVVGTCATRFCPLCTTSLAGLLELPSAAENNSTTAV